MRTRIAVLLLLAVTICAACAATVAPHRARAAISPVALPATATDTSAPVLGVNDYYVDACNVSEGTVLAEANAMVSSGLAAAGYNQLNIDDCWESTTRDSAGNLAGDPVRFPHGMGWLAGQVHALGLKFGLYTSAGTRTCHGLPGSLGFYKRDVAQFAAWGVDMIKVDYCAVPGTTESAVAGDFQRFGADVNAASRPMIYSQELPIFGITHGGVGSSVWLQGIQDSAAMGANSWRVAPDFNLDTPQSQIFGHLSADLGLAGYASPGHWNDLDIVSACTQARQWGDEWLRRELSIWAEMASPILIGCPLPLTSTQLGIFTDPAMLAVDHSGAQGILQATVNGIEFISKPGSLLVVNPTGTARTATFSPARAGMSGTAGLVNAWNGTVITGDTWSLGAYGVRLLTTP